MFFLIGLILIAQIIIMVNIVIYSIKFDVQINAFRKNLIVLNPVIKKRASLLKSIMSDINGTFQNFEDKVKQKRDVLMVVKFFDLLEWLLLLVVKPQGKKFILGYKLSKALVRELSSVKNMV